MKILIYSYHYHPEPIGIAPIITELAEGFVKRGHQVSVVTSMPNYPERQIYENYRGKLYCTEIINGVTVERSYVWICPKPTWLDLILQDVTFVLTSFINALKGTRPDVILIISPPLSVSIPAVILGWIYRCPVVLNLQDILLDRSVYFGLLRNPKVIWFFEVLAKFAYRNASKITVINDGFVENLRHKGIPEDKIVQIYNSIDIQFIKPVPKEANEFRTEDHLNGKFVVMCYGYISCWAGLDPIISAAVRLRHIPEIAIVIVGEKSSLEELRREEEHAMKQWQQSAMKEWLLKLEDSVKQSQLLLQNSLKKWLIDIDTSTVSNIKLLPFQSRKKLPEMLAAADVGLVVQRNRPDFYLPTKIPILMASGRAIVLSLPQTNTAARVVEQSGSGIVVPPEDPKALAAAILELYCNPDRVKIMGDKGRKYAEDNYSLERALNLYDKIFDTIVIV